MSEIGGRRSVSRPRPCPGYGSGPHGRRPAKVLAVPQRPATIAAKVTRESLRKL